jgi:hypothetical protein
MNKASNILRFFALGAAFVGVMAFTGGLMGAIGGFLLVLLTQNVLGLNAGLITLMPTTMVLGVVGFVGLGFFLMAPHAPALVLQPQIVTNLAANSESN